MITPINSAPVPMRKIRRAAVAMSVELMHRTHPGTNRLISSDDAVQKDCATANHYRGSKDEANSANDRVDCHKLVCSCYDEKYVLSFTTVLSFSTFQNFIYVC